LRQGLDTSGKSVIGDVIGSRPRETTSLAWAHFAPSISACSAYIQGITDRPKWCQWL